MAPADKSRKADEAKLLRETMRALNNRFRDWVEGTMWPQGMTMAQLRLLYAVDKEPEASAAAIARLCQVTPQTLQVMMQRAVREAWLVRRPAVRNARILTASLTPRGAALLAEARDAVTAFELKVWRHVSTAELQSFNAVFSEAVRRMEQVGTDVLVDRSESKGKKSKRPK